MAKLEERVYIVDGARTPFLKAKGKPGPFSASDLAVKAAMALMKRHAISAKDLDEVIIGCTMPSPDEANIGRVVALRVGCDIHTPAYTVMRNCASGMQALDSAYKDIISGRHHLVLAGGTDAMSRAPLLWNHRMVNWLAGFMGARSVSAKLPMFLKLRVGFLKPVIALLRGLTDPFTGLSMGQTAENIAFDFSITRNDMDAFAVNSHKKCAAAQEAHHFDNEIITLFDDNGNYYAADDGIRTDSSTEKLKKLKPFFDKKFGAVTAGNSSQITDGAAMLLLASEAAVKKYQLPVLAKMTATHWAGVAPEVMGLGPVHASKTLLDQLKLSISDIDFWEINEAFAAQVIGCLKAMADSNYCQQEFDSKSIGQITDDKLNIDGGAIAQGHPVGATGARLVLHMAHILNRQQAKRGIASLCIGGGQGGAVLVEAANS